MTAAAIDIGTNTILCLTGRLDGEGELLVLDDVCATARLGEGLARRGRLDDAAIERAVEILRVQLACARELGADRVRAVGTAVLRRAEDAQRFLDACEAALGLVVEVLPEAEEARLGHAAVRGPEGAEAIVVDVGGGSTEVVTEGGAICLSAPVGSVTLTEQHAGDLGALVAEVAQACAVFPAGAAAGREVMLLGGTASNLACLEAGVPAFTPAAAEGRSLPAAAAARWMARLADLSLLERRALPIEADRAEILPAGLACVAGALQRLEAASARVTGRGLRYGVLRELLGTP